MIVLFSDFGLEGPYTGQVEGRVVPNGSRNSGDRPFRRCAAQGSPAGSLFAGRVRRVVPPGTVILAVVDPGVGGPRAAVIVEAGERWYVGPDNGLFEIVARRAGQARCWELVEHPPAMSASFHGRDLFAPAAGRLARGERPGGLARPSGLSRRPAWPDDLAEIVYVDRYGNAMTGLRAALLPGGARLSAKGRVLARARTFSDVPEGDAFWYENSNGLAEIAVNAGRADSGLGISVGTEVAILT